MSSITESQAKEAVAQRWKSEWNAIHPDIPYCLENEKFSEPSPPSPWAKVVLRPLDSRQHTLGSVGNRTYRRESAVWVHLYGVLDDGSEALNGLVDDVRTIFEGVSFGGIDSVDGARTEIVGSDGRWYEVVVISPVTYYEHR